MVEKLGSVFKQMRMHEGKKDLVALIDYITIENEDLLRQNIKNSNLANNNVRNELIKIALANTDGEHDIDELRAY